MTKYTDITFQNNTFSLLGELDFSNVMSVYKKSIQYLEQGSEFTFDFSQLKNSNSAGLALIIEWIKFSKRRNKRIHFKSVSLDLLSIAKAAGLDKIILEE